MYRVILYTLVLFVASFGQQKSLISTVKKPLADTTIVGSNWSIKSVYLKDVNQWLTSIWVRHTEEKPGSVYYYIQDAYHPEQMCKLWSKQPIYHVVTKAKLTWDWNYTFQMRMDEEYYKGTMNPAIGKKIKYTLYGAAVASAAWILIILMGRG